MATGLGIDYGTTNSTLCMYDGNGYRYVDLESTGRTIPSLMYIDRSYYPVFGESARRRFLEDNLNRSIKLEKTDLGYIEITVGDGAYAMFESSPFSPAATTYDAKVTAFTDQNMPGFLFASTKRLLGRSSIASIRVFEKDFRLEAVVSSVIRNMRSKTEEALSSVSNPDVCVGRPVNYECGVNQDQDECNRFALDRMDRAIRYSGIETYMFLQEPVAPVLTYLNENPGDQSRRLLVLDFGGGTLDLSLLDRHDDRLIVAGNTGFALGGDIITELLIKDHIFPQLGLTAENLKTLRKHNNHLGEMIPDILNWRTTYTLHQPKYFMQIAEAIRILPEAAHDLNRIRLLIVNNHSYNVFDAVDSAKKRLTDVNETEIRLDPVGISFTISREDLNQTLAPYLESVVSAADALRAETGNKLDGVDRVLLTGGTSLIPGIRKRIEELFPGRVEPIDPFLSIVKGFAFAAWLRGHGGISQDGNSFRIT